MTMIEKIARAICVVEDGVGSPDVLHLGEPCWKAYEPDAIAALTAMLEPSEGMVGAAFPGLNLCRETSDAPTVEITRAWQAMISKAIEEGEVQPEPETPAYIGSK